MKKIKIALSLTLIIVLLLSLGAQSFADQYESDESTNPELSVYSDIENAYIKYSRLCELGQAPEVSFEDFVTAFENSEYDDAGLFLESIMDENQPTDDTIRPLPPDAETASNGDTWYFDIGTKLPRAAKYSAYNLLSLVKKGDIIHETEGNSAWFLGHASIVEGIFWDSTYGQFYIRVIEAGKGGVTRGVFDETRLANKEGTILRVSTATDAQRSSAVNFCVSQMGKGYLLHTPKHSAASSESWYCSELVWAAYKNQGIELLNTPTKEDVTPKDLYLSNKTTIIAYSQTKPASKFTDTSGHWAKSSIDYLVNNGIMAGVNATTFSPNANITRLTFIVSIYKLSGCPSASATHYFNDTSSLSYFELMAVRWAATSNIVQGYSDGGLHPNEHLTREQFATLLYRYASYIRASTSYNSNALSGFSDASSVSSYAVTAMKWAVSKGIVSGTTSTTLSPTASCTRAETATMLKRFIDSCM